MRISDWSSDVCSSDLAAPAPAISPVLDAAGRRRALYRIGAERFRDRALLAWAASDAPPDDPRWSDLVAAADTWQPVTLPVTGADRSEEHTSELQSLMRISYAVFCLKKKNNKNENEQCI